MNLYTDQLGNTIEVSSFPKRILSLVPSQTELLYDLGLDEAVIGITKFCVHPDSWFRNKTRVGGTKNLDIEKIKQLRPDLIIANKEENVKEQVEVLQQIAPAWVSDVNDLYDALSMIASIGRITGTITKAQALIDNIRNSFTQLPTVISNLSTATYLIWKDPYMTVGGDTFISDMMRHAGFVNVFADKKRYPEITPEDIRHSQCELVMLSSEPYPFKETHISELKSLLPDQKFIIADGEMFSWYGSRLQHAPGYFSKLRETIRQ
jgi:ABC-type Fe3+-hydroxamate transport system substrate-binding protein